MALCGLDTVKSVPLVSFKERLYRKGIPFYKLLYQKRSRKDLVQCDSSFFFNIFIKFKLCVRNWNTYALKTHLEKRILSSGYWVCSGYSWDRAVYSDRWKMRKMLPLSCKGADTLLSQIPTVPSLFDFHASFKIEWMWWPWGWHNF